MTPRDAGQSERWREPFAAGVVIHCETMLKSAFLFSLVLLILLPGCSDMSDRFDAKLWQAQHNSTAFDNPRAGQIESLQRDHMRAGMSRADVRALLGEPEASTPGMDRYALGVAPLGIDPQTYVIRYDDSGRVAGFKVVSR